MTPMVPHNHSEIFECITTAVLFAEPVESGLLLSSQTRNQGKKPQPRNKGMKTPKQPRFISFFFCLSPGRNDTYTAQRALHY